MDKNYKKQLKARFLESKPLMGVLTILNTAENKIYVAGSMHVAALSNKIKFTLNSGQFNNLTLQEDWKRLGEGNFVFDHPVIIVPEENKMIDYKRQIQKAGNDMKEKLSKTIDIY
ncbi:GIY-YIG nuclease family protein [uncultured Chryseobacterium sp.]|uniref:GIY-YIG nuclease family protein n=1 Tax=uncultured Chryseobacterium sp. TaxID=259322 RepID=UPI0025F7C458|nr:GIY-YIG nuclease family protein [uncultured Chryseobacterium sp.]